MANSFNIKIPYKEGTLHANVYVYTRNVREFHISFVGSALPEFLKNDLVLVAGAHGLKALDNKMPPELVEAVVREIEREAKG